MAIDVNASLAHLRQMKERSRDLQQQIKNCQDERQKLEEQFELHLVEHAQAECKQLVYMIRTMLPQELKELIYQYLYLEDGPIPIGSYHFTTYVPYPLRTGPDITSMPNETFMVVPEGAQDHSVERDRNIVLPDSHLLDPAYLGYVVAREASRYYYKSNTFSVCVLENALHDFLFTDPIYQFPKNINSRKKVSRLGLPIDHIRNLQIRVKHEHYNTFLSFYDNLFDGESILNRETFDILHDFTARVNSATAPQLHIEFLLMTGYKLDQDEEVNYNFQRHHINLLEAIRVPFYKLKHDLGANVTVIHYDEHRVYIPRNITAMFQLTREQWEYEKGAHHGAAIKYSPLHYYIAHADKYEGRQGFHEFDHGNILKYRWGVENAWDYQPRVNTIAPSEFWPLGNTEPWFRGHRS